MHIVCTRHQMVLSEQRENSAGSPFPQEGSKLSPAEALGDEWWAPGIA